MVYRTFHFWKKPGLTKLLCRFVTSLNCCFDVVNFPNWGSLAELLDLGKQKTLHKITMISTTTIATTTTTALHNAATRKLQLQPNLQLHTIQPQLQPTTQLHIITLQLHLQDTRPTTRNYRCNYNCNCCNCNYNFNHKPLPLPLQQLEERVVVWVDLKSLKVWKNCVQCAVYSVQCNVQCSESVCERLEAGGRRWQACRAKKQEPHTHSATGHNIALPRQTK